MQDPKGILEDDVLPDGTVLKKGGLVTYVPYSSGRMTELWGADASEFRPERWLKDGVFIPVSPFKFNAFQVLFNWQHFTCLSVILPLSVLLPLSYSLLP